MTAHWEEGKERRGSEENEEHGFIVSIYSNCKQVQARAQSAAPGNDKRYILWATMSLVG